MRRILCSVNGIALALAFGCGRVSEPPSEAAFDEPNLRPEVRLWHETSDVAHAMETYLRKSRRLPTRVAQIRNSLPERMVSQHDSGQLGIEFRKVPTGKSRMSDPEQPFVRVEVTLTGGGRRVTEGYDLTFDSLRVED